MSKRLRRAARLGSQEPRRPALRGRCDEESGPALARPAAAQHRVVSRAQPDRRHHRGVRPGPGRPRGRHPRQERDLYLGRRRQGLSADRARRHVSSGLEHRGAGALPEAGDLRDGEIRHGRRLRAGDGVRHPPRHQGHGAGAAGSHARADSRQRRQPARGADRRPDAGGGHDDARPPHPGAGGACLGSRHPRRRGFRRRSTN